MENITIFVYLSGTIYSYLSYIQYLIKVIVWNSKKMICQCVTLPVLISKVFTKFGLNLYQSLPPALLQCMSHKIKSQQP